MKKLHAVDLRIFRPRPNPAPKLRLFCVPYAGRGASLYREWPDFLSPEVELCAYQLPGRESRLRDPLFTRIAGAVDEAAGIFEPYLDVPFALFGHSMGALICFELARRLRSRHGVVPVHLFLSARRAPQLPDPKPKLTPLRDEQFVAEMLRRYNGIPQGVLQDPELMELLLPALRADVEMLETYTYAPEAPLECPISAFGGCDDTQTSLDELAAWREHTSSQFQTKIFPGDHFFIQSKQTEILSEISRHLKPDSASFLKGNN
jgi:medium-chain acyl-[acyl-carrier-protein] hydrolase